MKRALLTALLAACYGAAHAESFFQFEAGIGATHYATINGRWYQNGMPDNSVSPTNLALSVGVTGNALARGRLGVDWHVDYVNLGRAAASCMCTPNDENYNATTSRYSPDTKPAPLAYFTGGGRSQGFVLSLEPYYYVQSIRIGVEVGAYVNNADWTENVYGWAPSYEDVPRDLHIHTNYWGVVPVVGARVSHGPWSIGYRHYFTSRQKMHIEYPPLWQDIDVLELQYRF